MENYNAYCMTYQRQIGELLGGFLTHRVLLAKRSEYVLTVLKLYL